MSKKFLALVLSAAILCPVFSGCSAQSKSGASSATSAAKVVTCKYVVPGDEPKDNDKVLALINDKMAKDGVGVKLDVQYIPWDSWDSKINVMLSTGEKFDMFTVMNDRVSLSNYAGRGALADVTDLVKKYGSNIIKNDPDIMMKSGQVNGVQYGIPSYWFESSIAPQITIRLDIMKKYGITKVPTTFDELTADYVTIMKNWKGSVKPYLPLLGSTTTDFGCADKTYTTWPYTLYQNNIVYVNQDGTIKDYYETDEWKQDCANARKWYQLGLLNPDVITTTTDQLNNQLDSGDWFVYFGTYGKSIDNIKKNYPTITVDDFGWVDFASSKPNVRPYGTRNMQAIPKASKNPEAAVKVINWIYANQDNYDLFMYGREGTDYTKVGAKNRVDIVNAATSTPLYYFSDWMIGNLNFERIANGTPTITNKLLYNQDKTAVDGIASQFTFDATSVQTQLTDVSTQISSDIVPIACGVKDYNSSYSSALSMLKKAGVDDIIAEYKKQFDAFKAKQ